MHTRKSYLSERQKQLLQTLDATVYDYSDGNVVVIYDQRPDFRSSTLRWLITLIQSFNCGLIEAYSIEDLRRCALCCMAFANKTWKVGGTHVAVCAGCTQCVIKSTTGNHIIGMNDGILYMMIRRGDAYHVMYYTTMPAIAWINDRGHNSSNRAYVCGLMKYFELYSRALQYVADTMFYLPHEVRYRIINLALHDNPFRDG